MAWSVVSAVSVSALVTVLSWTILFSTASIASLLRSLVTMVTGILTTLGVRGIVGHWTIAARCSASEVAILIVVMVAPLAQLVLHLDLHLDLILHLYFHFDLVRARTVLRLLQVTSSMTTMLDLDLLLHVAGVIGAIVVGGQALHHLRGALGTQA